MNGYQESYIRALQLIDDGQPVLRVLSYLTMAAEEAAGLDTVSSILLLDEQGLLRNGASPRLPADYLKAIDGLQPRAHIGTCSAAAATGSMVITEDFCTDEKWPELRHLPMALGFKGAWSLPIKNVAGDVVGTFGTYFREKRTPSQKEIDGVKMLAHAAASALQRSAHATPGY